MTNATRFNRNDTVGYNRVTRIMRALEFILIEILVASAALRAEDTVKNNVMEGCKLPLGMEEGKIPDEAITASSSYESKSVGPQNARIRQEKNGGAWCPKAQISSEVREYLEVDLTRDHLITWTETQGRFGNGQGQEYAESFFLEYWRDSRWHPYKSLGGDRILRGNSNTYLVEQQKLELPFVASRVRFVPYSQHPRTVCMRVEIFGCVWDQGTRRYEAPRGRVFGPEGANAEDLSYDGTEVEGEGLMGAGGERLTGGLGQLTDGVIGEDPYRIESSSSSTRWVGWTDLNPVIIVFEFYETRRFKESTMYVANAPDKGVEPFSRVRCRFSRDGENYEAETMAEFVGSTRAGVAILSMDLNSRVGRFVKFEMVPRSKWLLVSEITFQSDPVVDATGESWNEAIVRHNNRTEEEEDEEEEAASSATVRTEASSSNSSYVDDEKYRETNLAPDAFPVDVSRTYIGLVSGALTLLALLLACTIFLVKLRGRNKVALVQKHTALLCGSPAVAAGLASNSTKRDVKNRRLAVSRSLLRSVDKATPGMGQNCATIGGYDAQRDSSNDHCSLYEKTYKLFSEENLAYERHPVCNNEYTGVATFSREADERDEATLWKEGGDGGGTPLRTPFPLKRRASSAQASKHEGYYAATDILTIKRREAERQPGGGGTSLFTSLRIDECPRLADAPNSFKIQRISRHRLRILDKIGEGSFGFVHLCEAKGIQSLETTTTTTTTMTTVSGTASRNRRVVVVRSLWRGVTDSFKKAFVRDMCALAEIRDPNIARIIALVEEEPFGAVFEYGQLGDLPNYVRGEDREESERQNHLGFGSLLNILTRIASGMKYLESIDLPHCDLAARNCVVGNNLEIKISDHAVYRAKYDNEYYVNECNAKIPLRWMAWEAVLLGKRNSCRADVWSYATTAWEILNRCEEMPFSNMTSEQVLQNCGRWYHGSGGSTMDRKNEPCVPEQPASCPRDLYRLMTECWSKRPEDRPTFQQIHSFLVRLETD